jgi:hypothetical protein
MTELASSFSITTVTMREVAAAGTAAGLGSATGGPGAACPQAVAEQAVARTASAAAARRAVIKPQLDAARRFSRRFPPGGGYAS